MINPENYFEQVYASVLGKVIGVYMGRPFEGWTYDRISSKWGVVDRYVFKDQDVPLVVADDDISGTFTFVRALEDSGLYADTKADFFGETWLNYLIEGKTVLWWGGMGVSTEHTAYIRLKNGVQSPESGSTRLNGKVVSEQIGAQIFIDAFGMVAPGNPGLAMELAEKAAGVSHDGEALIAAKVVAAMVSLAFVDKDIHSILSKVLAMIPADSLIAKIHRDVRKWAAEDRDWRKTYFRIKDMYGYDKFGGGCHVVPNHAIMVMAWEYAGNDFFESQKIINTCGWDTDCNAANVGSVCALICGLKGLDSVYPFHAHPEFADRILLPTSDGTYAVTDCLQVARRITRIGCRISGIKLPEKVSNAVWHDFSLHGALHGYCGKDENSRVSYDGRDGGGAKLDFKAFVNHPAVMETPVLPGETGVYSVMATPSLYHGMMLRSEVACDALSGEGASVCFEVDCVPHPGEDASSPLPFRSSPVRLVAGETATLSWKIDTGYRLIRALRICVCSERESSGTLRVRFVSAEGEAEVRIGDNASVAPGAPVSTAGYIATLSHSWFRQRLCRDEGDGFLVTGGLNWKDVTLSATLSTHCSDRAGVVFAYQGLRRYYAAVLSHGKFQIIRNYYGEEVLFEKETDVVEDENFRIDVVTRDGNVAVKVDGKPFAEFRDEILTCGGAGLYVRTGVMTQHGDVVISASVG